MATVNICDRCGAFCKNDVLYTISTYDVNDRSRTSEVCGVCRTEFDMWMATDANRSGLSVNTKYEKELTLDPKMVAMAKVVAQEYVAAQQKAAQKTLEQ